MAEALRGGLSPAASLSLDLLRAATASAVVLYHVSWMGLDGGALRFLAPKLGHSAVVVFFVLSGFVIAASTRPGSSGLDYAIKRASRVYSVAVPALLLVIVLDYIARAQGVVAPDAYQLRQPVPYLGLHLLFAGDLWWLAITAFSMGPYWSLNYEVWYYVVFGAWMFTPGPARYGAAGLALLLMGPKIALLLPVWLTGLWVYALSQRWPLPRWVARGVAAASVVFLVAFAGSAWDEGLNGAGEALTTLLGMPLRFSQWFAGDYVRGVATAALIWGLCGAEIAWPALIARGGRVLAGVSFSLYLLHYPLMGFLKGVHKGAGPLDAVGAIGTALLFGAVFEPQRGRLRRLLIWISRLRMPRRI